MSVVDDRKNTNLRKVLSRRILQSSQAKYPERKQSSPAMFDMWRGGKKRDSVMSWLWTRKRKKTY